MATPLMEPEARALSHEHAARMARLVRAQFGFVWRLLRRIGVADTEADSAAIQVFDAAAQRIGDIRSGSERAFLLSSSVHVAARVQRERAEQAAVTDTAPALEDLDEAEQAREILGVLLQQMPLQLRVVFILHEIEQLPATDIAEIIGIPLGTVASRLSESLDDFATHLEAGSSMAESLLAAAREEEPSAAPLQRALLAFGASSAGPAATATAETDVISASDPALAPLAPSAAARPALSIAAKWLGIGLLTGALITCAWYSLTEAVASSHAAAR
ncbi:MAG: RNA polymerase sigma factor [Pseudomonadota bacterium]